MKTKTKHIGRDIEPIEQIECCDTQLVKFNWNAGLDVHIPAQYGRVIE